MIQFFMNGGLFMWPLLIFAIVIVVLTVKKAIDFFGRQNVNPAKMESGINAILFWGFMSLVVGFYAHFQGLYMAMQAIIKADDISPVIVTAGYAQSLITILFGLCSFIISSVVWFIFRWQYKKLTVKTK
jgi:biopolymer transport protein ExbB/TolQ